MDAVLAGTRPPPLGALSPPLDRKHRSRQTGCYAGGWLVLGLALVSPIHHWGAQLFTIHMVEHELIMAIAAPLIVLARPAAAFAWALPPAARRRLGRDRGAPETNACAGGRNRC
jgi:cytochrome c oxidase assembly factor CtaG